MIFESTLKIIQIINIHGKNGFVERSKILVGYKSSNFVEIKIIM